MPKKRVAVLSIYYHNWNFGALLQSYALNYVLRTIGYNAEHIRFCYAEPALKSSSPKKRIRTVLMRHRITAHCLERFFCLKEGNMKNRKKFYEFHDKAIHGSLCCYDAITVSKLNKKYDVLITGSDQVWNPVFWSDRLLQVFGLAFADKSKKTLSYAASIGSEKSILGKEDLFRYILGKIDYISVREQVAVDYLQPLVNKPIYTVLDPTLLLRYDQWNQIAGKTNQSMPYVFAYFLEEEELHTSQLFHIADQVGAKIKCISGEEGIYVRAGGDCHITDAGPREFLALIRDSKVVVTNSFHGMVFSVIFHKPFWVVKRFKDTDEKSMNNRITDFLKEVGLEERLLGDEDYPDMEWLSQPIDYKRIDKKIQKKRQESLRWLENALVAE